MSERKHQEEFGVPDDQEPLYRLRTALIYLSAGLPRLRSADGSAVKVKILI